MSLSDRLGNAIGAANEASKSFKGMKDKIITSAEKTSSNFQQSIKDGASGKKRKLEEDDIRANQRAAAAAKLNAIDEEILEQKQEEISIIDGMVIDRTRNHFDEIGEFNDTNMVEEIKVGDEIRDWLEGRM